MLRLCYPSWLVICAVLISTVAPAFPARAASIAAVHAPIRQDDLTDRIAEIRSGAPDIEDDFSDAYGHFVTGYDGTTAAYLKSGELRIAVDEENTITWSSLDRAVGDFYAEVDVVHREGSQDNQFGFLARFEEGNNYYLFATSSDGYYTIQTHIDDEWNALIDWQESNLIVTGEGERNTLALLAEGDTYTFLINDAIVESITDSSLSGTTLALNAAAFSEPGIDIGFDNFKLWYVGEPIDAAPRQAPIDARNVTVTPGPTETATAEVTAEVTEEPTGEPTEEPTADVTATPTPEVTEEPTDEPTAEPTTEPTAEPTAEPTVVTGTSSDPAIAAIQGQSPTFSDDFEEGDISDWLHFPSDAVVYELFEGALEFVFNTSNVLTWSELPVAVTNYYLEVDTTIVSSILNAEYGIIFNYDDSQNFYLFAVNNDSRFSVWQLLNNGWVEIYAWADSSVLVSGEGNTNRLGLLVDGTSVTLAANDEVLAVIELDEAVSGSVALAAGTFEEAGLIISFDNVMLWDLDELGPLPTAEPTVEATDEPTVEPTGEPTDEPLSGDFAEISAAIDEIVATDPYLVDDFRRDTGNWDIQSHDVGAYYYESRIFHIEATAEQRIVWSAYLEGNSPDEPVQFADFYVEFDTSFVTLTGENAAGLVFRAVDTDNFYKFVVDEIGYYQLQKRVDGTYIDLIEWNVTDTANIDEGGTNRIGILADGTTLAFSVNGTIVGAVEDSDLASGSMALAIQTYSTPEGHSTFDNLELWVLDE